MHRWTKEDFLSKLVCPEDNIITRRSDPEKIDDAKYRSFIAVGFLLDCLDEAEPEFYIGKNVDGFGKFGDIVVKRRYTTSTGKEMMKMLLVHCHNVKGVITIDNLASFLDINEEELQLIKLYNDYQQIVGNVGKFEDSMLNDCELEDITFMVCTQSSFEIQTKEKTFQFINGQPEFSKFFKALEKQNLPLYMEGNAFFNKLTIQSQHNGIRDKDDLKAKLGSHLLNSGISLAEAFDNVSSYIARSRYWISRDAKPFLNILLNVNGAVTNIKNIVVHISPTVIEKMIMQYMCNKGHIIKIGKSLSASTCKKYIKRYLPGGVNNDKTIFLCNEPGMGKSVYFIHKAHEIKGKYPKKWVICENLKDVAHLVKDVNMRFKERGAKMFLAQLAGVAQKNTLENDMLQCWLSMDKQVVVFLDGIEDIDIKYLDKVISIIHAIHTTTGVQLWISGRNALKKPLEDILKLKCVSLSKFSVQDITKFVKNYSKAPLSDINQSDSYLLENPLLCRMYCNKLNEEKPETHKILEHYTHIYEKYLEIKHDVFISNHKEIFNSLKFKRRSIAHHRAAAVVQLCTGGYFLNLRREISARIGEFYDKFLDNEYKLEGLMIYAQSGMPEFKDHRLAAYLAASWFVDNRDNHVFAELYKDHQIPSPVACFKDVMLKNIEIAGPFKNANLFEDTNVFKKMMLNGYVLTKPDVDYCLTKLLTSSLNAELSCYLSAYWLQNYVNNFENNLDKFWFTSESLLSLVLFANPKIYYYFILISSMGCELHAAIFKEDIGKVVDVLNSEHCCVRCSDVYHYFTPLHSAIYLRNNKIIKILIENNHIFRRNGPLNQISHEFMDEETIDYLKFYFPQEFTLNNDISKTISVEFFHEREEQIMGNCNVNDYFGVNGILLACASNPEDLTPLHVAAFCSQDFALFHFLIKANDFVYKADSFGFFPHDYAEKEVKEFLRGFAFANAVTPLPDKVKRVYDESIIACVKQCTHLMNEWFKLGVCYKLQLDWYTKNDIDFKIPFGRSILRYHIHNNSYKVNVCNFLLAKHLYELLQKGRFIDLVDTLCKFSSPKLVYHFNRLICYNHPLHMAVLDGNRRDIKSLSIHKDEFINRKNIINLSPLDIAICMENEDAQKLLLAKISSFTFNTLMHHQFGVNFTITPDNGNVIVKDLSYRSIILNTKYSKEAFPLHHAIQTNDIYSFNLNVDDRNKNRTDSKGYSALHIAATYGNIEICKKLLSHEDIIIGKDVYDMYPHAYTLNMELRNLFVKHMFTKNTLENETILGYYVTDLIPNAFY